ncbi:MAG: hypothetical protein K2H19_00105 [Ruminococcus sp.]|nr:hypothetical protein [Ruminococcus sp.]
MSKAWNNSGFVTGKEHFDGSSAVTMMLCKELLLDEIIEVINIREGTEFALLRNNSYRISFQSGNYCGYISVKRNKKAYNLQIGQKIRIKGKIRVALTDVQDPKYNLPRYPRFLFKESKPFCFSFDLISEFNPVY